MSLFAGLIGNSLPILLFVMCGLVAAQPSIDRPQDSNMKAGQLFNVRIAPAGKRIEVFIAGRDAASIDFSNVNLKATVTVGTKRWFFIPKKESDHFVLSTPPDFPVRAESELHLQFNSKEKEETMKFNLKPLE